jgi:hypothetical protein
MTPEPILHSSPDPAHKAGPAAAGLFVAAFGLLLGSSPARGPGPWAHLADGRAVAHGAVGRAGPTWLYDLGGYGLYGALGGAGLVAVKAVAVAALALVLFRLGRTTGRVLIPVACAGLAVLALGTRVPLAPVTVSYFLLALAAGWAWRAATDAPAWPGWWPVALFAAWGGIDRWFALGLATVALVQLGRWLDDRSAGGRGLLRALAALAVLAAVAVAAHLVGLLHPEGLGWASTYGPAEGPASSAGLVSPFGRAYRTAAGTSPAALAYYPLLGLGVVSFLLAPWRWARFLPWAALAALSGYQARAVPFFAVVAGPVLAWNLQDFFARRSSRQGDKETGRQRDGETGTAPVMEPGFRFRRLLPSPPLLVSLSACLIGAAFLAAAWPGWLQGPPYEPRRWALQPPPGLGQAAAVVCQEHAGNGPRAGTRTLHLARDTASVFTWFCPHDDAVLDPRLAADLAGEDGSDVGERLAAAGVGRVVISTADRGPPVAAMTRLFGDPGRWPLLHLEAGVAVFGYRGDARNGVSGTPAGSEADLDRLAFRPEPGEKAPQAPEPGRRWWDAFWKLVPAPAGDREQAAALLLLAEVARQPPGAQARHLAAWEAGQLAALTAAAAGRPGTGGAADVSLRLTLLRPPLPASGSALPSITRYTFDCQRQFMLARDDAPLGVLYAAVRAARRALAVDPADARGHLLLGQCYVRLLTATRERTWALGLPQLAQLRQAQASAALVRAAALNPGLAQAHLELGRLYQQVGYLDLALAELRAYRAAASRDVAGGGRESVPDDLLDALAGRVEGARAAFASESARGRVADRAQAALQRGLAGEARSLLLESDVSLFGAEGTELEVDLLLRTGRAGDVRDWTAAELKGTLGGKGYHWLRAQALAALGEYAAADDELAELAKEGGPLPAPAVEVFALLAGRAVADEQRNAVGLPAALARAFAWSEFGTAVRRESAALALRADAATLRGLLALESGEVAAARESFRSALAHSADTPGGGGLAFNGWETAHGALQLLRQGGGPR